MIPDITSNEVLIFLYILTVRSRVKVSIEGVNLKPEADFSFSIEDARAMRSQWVTADDALDPARRDGRALGWVRR